MAEVIRYTKPDVIITHCFEDYMTDHSETGRLMFYCSFASSIPHYETSNECFAPVVPIFHMESSCGVGFVPDEYVDISEFIDVKLEALNCHKSRCACGYLSEASGGSVNAYIGSTTHCTSLEESVCAHAHTGSAASMASVASASMR